MMTRLRGRIRNAGLSDRQAVVCCNPGGHGKLRLSGPERISSVCERCSNWVVGLELQLEGQFRFERAESACGCSSVDRASVFGLGRWVRCSSESGESTEEASVRW